MRDLCVGHAHVGKRIERWLATTRGGVVLVVLGCLFLLFYAIVYAALEGVL